MANAKVKTEHASAKNGGGAWTKRAFAKQASKKRRRKADKKEVGCTCGARPWEYEPCTCGKGTSPEEYYGLFTRATGITNDWPGKKECS